MKLEMKLLFKNQLTGWINGWTDATGDHYTDICINKKAKKKLINFINCITDCSDLRKEIFDEIFEEYNFIYCIDSDDIIKLN